jgi:hypothetical protein
LTRKFVLTFKRRVIAAIVRYFDVGLVYTPEGSISQDDFEASRLFRMKIDHYTGEDRVEGTLGKTAVRLSEVHAQYVTVRNKSTTWRTIFYGLLFIGDFNKHFEGTTLVLPQTAETLFGRLGEMFQSLKASRSPDLVKLEDPEFEKHFMVYGDDQVESRYILTPSLMQRIVAFRESTGQALYLSFRHQNVYLAISSHRDMFEPRVFRSLLDRALIQTYVADMEMALGIVEDLNLNTRIWTKT